MYNVKNLRTGKLLKDACSRKLLTYETKEHAETTAHSMNRFAAVGEKKDRYVVVLAA